jgi:hypothetical protein
VAAVVLGFLLLGDDDEDAPLLRVSDTTAEEGSSGQRSFAFVVSVSGELDGPATVRYSTARGTVRGGADFRATAGTLEFGEDGGSRRVTVQVSGDTEPEPDEAFQLRLSNASANVTIWDGTGVGLIVDDDRPASPRVAAAGDIACDPGSSAFEDGRGETDACRQQETSDLAVVGRHDAVLILGDIQYDDGAPSKWEDSYDPTWGRVKDITRPAPGNHEYLTDGAAGYFEYFGSAAGDPETGWYSFDVGEWHLIALNSTCEEVGGCGANSPQLRWLRDDLARSDARCILAYWHTPRFSSGDHGDNPQMAAFWDVLEEAGAELVLSGHDHTYERFAPQTGARVANARGIRQFVVGSGGRDLYDFPVAKPNSEVRDGTTFGLMRLTLRRGGYDWLFLPAVGTFTDSGSGVCH